jgi:acetyl esterase/lipase
VPDIDVSRRIVYRIDGMSEAIAHRRHVYKRDGDSELHMDIYVPPTASERRGAICFVHGGPIPREMTPPREWAFFKSYGELAAASGLVGVVFHHRLHAPTDYPTADCDVTAAIEYVRTHAEELAVDRDRIALWVFSGGGPFVARWLRERPEWLRCLVAFYAILDIRHLLPTDADSERVARAHAFSPAAHLTQASAALPMFVARAGLDNPIFNNAIDLFVREALASNAELDLANHRDGHHGFDIEDDNDRSREIVGRAMAFVKARLSRA